MPGWNQRNITCHRCQRRGHVAANCRTRLPANRQAVQGPRHVATNRVVAAVAPATIAARAANGLAAASAYMADLSLSRLARGMGIMGTLLEESTHAAATRSAQVAAVPPPPPPPPHPARRYRQPRRQGPRQVWPQGFVLSPPQGSPQRPLSPATTDVVMTEAANFRHTVGVAAANPANAAARRATSAPPANNQPASSASSTTTTTAINAATTTAATDAARATADWAANA